jgi:hypothetical protein
VSKYTIRVARNQFADLILIDSDQDFYSEDSGLDVVKDLLDNNLDYAIGVDSIPLERGIYECEISYEAYQSNHPLDPVEWDTEIYIESVKKLV